MLIGASWPWNLSTVPTRASGGQESLDRADLGVVRRDDEDVVPADRPLMPASVDPRRVPPSTSDRASAATRLRLDRGFVVGAGRGHLDQARPDPVEQVDVASRAAGLPAAARLQAAVVEDLGREARTAPGAAATCARGTGHGPAASSPGPPRTCASADRSAPGGCEPLQAAGRAAAGRRAARGCRSRAPSRRRWRGRSGRPRRRTARRPRPASSPTPTARTSRRRGWPVRRRARRGRPPRPSHGVTARVVDDLVRRRRAGSAGRDARPGLRRPGRPAAGCR